MRVITSFFFISLFLCTSYVTAQSYRVEGKVVDQSGEIAPFAQVAVYRGDAGKPSTGTTTDQNGNFIIKLAEGNYRFVISYVGYKPRTLRKDVDSDVSLGTIDLEEDVKMMDEVVVESKEVRRPVVATKEGLEIKPDQTISNVGGTLLDILRNTPSVRVGDDGGISIRGSGSTNILINGRNSSLTSDLEQIPASAIKSIQIINNPNAKYDAQAAGGVINIKLKQGEKVGSTGSAEVSAGTRGRLSTSLRGSHVENSFKLYGGYSFRRWPSVGSSETMRRTFDDNQLLEQIGERSRSDNENTLNYGGTVFLNNNKLTYEGVFNRETERDTEINRARVSNFTSDEIITQYIRENIETEENYTIDNAVIYERLFEDDSKEFRALVSHSFRDQLENQNIDVYQGEFFLENVQGQSPDGKERASTDELNHTMIGQADYAQDLWDGRFEGGFKTTIRSFDTDYRYEILNTGTGEWVNQDNISNRFLYQDQVYAAYVIYSKTFGKLDLSAGTRAEQTVVNTRLFTNDETNMQQYLNFFPSLQTSYAVNSENTFKFSFSRRIDRPSGWRLNPFPDVTDSLNVRIGNPNLQPEYINSLELGHMFNQGGFSLTSNLFYRRVNNQVDWIVRVEDGISYRGPQNLLSSDNYGFELISTYDIFEWWQMNGSFSFFGVQVDGRNLDAAFTNSGTSWYAKFNSDFQLPMDFDLQITGNYTAPEIEAQGRDLARYYIDLSLQRDFFDEKMNASASFQDIFDTRNFQGENYGPDFVQTFTYKRETRIFLITLAYKMSS